MSTNHPHAGEAVITDIYRAERSTEYRLPLAEVSCQAGFPSPAEDYIESKLDLNDHLLEHPAATFFVRVAGDSMVNAGIHDGDILIVDRALEPVDGKIVIAAVDGELSVKRLRKENGDVYLQAENDDFEDIEISRESELHVWGVVTYVIHSV